MIEQITLYIQFKNFQNPPIDKENMNDFAFSLSLPPVVIEQTPISELIILKQLARLPSKHRGAAGENVN